MSLCISWCLTPKQATLNPTMNEIQYIVLSRPVVLNYRLDCANRLDQRADKQATLVGMLSSHCDPIELLTLQSFLIFTSIGKFLFFAIQKIK